MEANKNFDLCKHKVTQILIKCGGILFPEEKNITVLYEKTAFLLGVEIEHPTSKEATHLPTPEESARKNPKYAQICPSCGERAYYVRDLCRGCKEADGGKYKTKLECFRCHYTELSKEPSVVWLERWKIPYEMQTKASLGIKTVTDEGIK